jgi:hypothetical protein
LEIWKLSKYVVDPSINKLTKMHILSWKRGLKTSSYYVRVPALNSGKKITSSHTNRQSIRSSIVSTKVEEPDEEECLSCSA